MAPTLEQVQQMSQGATPLQVAGVTDTTPTPTAAPATEAPGALSGYPTAGVSAPLSDQLRNFSPIAVQRPGTAAQAAKNADTLTAATPNPSKPGSWARSLVGGMQSALAGGGLEGVLADANVPNARSGAQALTQVAANRAARMILGKIFLLEAACLQNGHRQRVAENQRGGRAACRREVERTCFFWNFHAQGQIAVPRERGFYIAG